MIAAQLVDTLAAVGFALVMALFAVGAVLANEGDHRARRDDEVSEECPGHSPDIPVDARGPR